MWKDYYIPDTIESAKKLLDNVTVKVKIIAGGTDLVPKIKSGQVVVDGIVDITKIPQLRDINENENRIMIGAAVTHSEISKSEIIKRHSFLLQKACLSVGSPQIRNVGTIGGNVVNALPAADSAVALLALDAYAHIYKEEKPTKIADLYSGIGISKIDNGKQIIKTFSFNGLLINEGSSFQRLSRRKALTLPIVNAAAVVSLNSDGSKFTNLRLVVAPVFNVPHPHRLVSIEESLIGLRASKSNIEKASTMAEEDVNMRSSLLRGSAVFRQKMVRVLIYRVLSEAVDEAQNKLRGVNNE